MPDRAEPHCGKCGKLMTPADSRIHPEFFLHDACLPPEMRPKASHAGLVYLACPYSHPDPVVRCERFRLSCKAAGALMRQGLYVFSPISQTHPIASLCDLPLGFDYWRDYNRAILSVCKALYVLEIDGWDTSKGVQAEIKMAEELKLPVLKFVDVEGNILEEFEYAAKR